MVWCQDLDLKTDPELINFINSVNSPATNPEHSIKKLRIRYTLKVHFEFTIQSAFYPTYPVSWVSGEESAEILSTGDGNPKDLSAKRKNKTRCNWRNDDSKIDLNPNSGLNLVENSSRHVGVPMLNRSMKRTGKKISRMSEKRIPGQISDQPMLHDEWFKRRPTSVPDVDY